jgi:hypothetical protein
MLPLGQLYNVQKLPSIRLPKMRDMVKVLLFMQQF